MLVYREFFLIARWTRAPLPQLPTGPVIINLQISLGKTNAVPHPGCMVRIVDEYGQKARIGSREDDVIGAPDIRPLQWTNRLKFERKKLCKNVWVPALGYGALDDEEECPKAP